MPITTLLNRRWVGMSAFVAWLTMFAGFRALTLPEEARCSSVAWALRAGSSKEILVDREAALVIGCGGVLWAVAPAGTERKMSELSRATRFRVHGAVLWRLGPPSC